MPKNVQEKAGYHYHHISKIKILVAAHDVTDLIAHLSNQKGYGTDWESLREGSQGMKYLEDENFL